MQRVSPLRSENGQALTTCLVSISSMALVSLL